MSGGGGEGREEGEVFDVLLTCCVRYVFIECTRNWLVEPGPTQPPNRNVSN